MTQLDLCYEIYVRTGQKVVHQHLNASIKGRETPSLKLRNAIATTLNLPLGEVFPEYHTTADKFCEWYRSLRASGRIDYGPLSVLSGVDYGRLVTILKKQDAPTYWERQALARVAGMEVSELFPEF